MKFNDAISGVVLLLFAVATIAYTWTFPSLPGQDYGPELFPRIIGGGMVVCSILLIVSGIRHRKSAPLAVFGDWARSPALVTNFVLVIAAALFYIFASDSLGFPLISTIILLVLFMRLGVRVLPSVLISIGVTFCIYQVFAGLLLVPLPLGLLESLIY